MFAWFAWLFAWLLCPCPLSFFGLAVKYDKTLLVNADSNKGCIAITPQIVAASAFALLALPTFPLCFVLRFFVCGLELFLCVFRLFSFLATLTLPCHSHHPIHHRSTPASGARSQTHNEADHILCLTLLSFFHLSAPPGSFALSSPASFFSFLKSVSPQQKQTTTQKQQQNTKPPKLANLPVNQESASCPNNNSSSSSSSSSSNQLCQQPLPQQRANRCCPRCQPPQQRRQAAATPPPPQSQRPQLLPAPQ